MKKNVEEKKEEVVISRKVAIATKAVTEDGGCLRAQRGKYQDRFLEGVGAMEK